MDLSMVASDLPVGPWSLARTPGSEMGCRRMSGVPSNVAMPPSDVPAEGFPFAEAATVLAMEKLVQWMTLQALRNELERTRQACVAVDRVTFADGQLSALSGDAHRHQLIADELLRRPSNG